MTFKKKKPVDMSTIFNWFAAIMGISLIIGVSIVLFLDNNNPTTPSYNAEWTVIPINWTMSDMLWNMCDSKKPIGQQYYGGFKLAKNNMYNKTILLCTYDSREGEVKFFHHCDARGCWNEEAFFPSSEGKQKVAFDMRIYVDTRTNGTLYELGNESEIKDLEGII